MERNFLAIFASLLLFLSSCQDTTAPETELADLDTPPTTELNFSGEEGAIITLEEAQSMTLKYQQMHPNQTQAFFLGADYLNDLLDQKSSLGVRFYLGMDGEMQHQLVGVGVDDTGTDLLNRSIVHATTSCTSDCNSNSPLWHGEKNRSVDIEVSQNDGEQITLDQAQLFTHFYQKLNPKSQKAFFYGQKVLRELLSESGTTGLWFYMGINEIDELELLPMTEISTTSARFAEIGPALTADRTSPCPPLCNRLSPLMLNDR